MVTAPGRAKLTIMRVSASESCEQTGHRRMITSALASAHSAFSLLCAAENGIKTIVQMGLCPGYRDRSKILPRARSPRPFQKSLLERISNSAPRQLLPPQPPWYWPVKFGDPNERGHPDVNRAPSDANGGFYGQGLGPLALTARSRETADTRGFARIPVRVVGHRRRSPPDFEARSTPVQ
jgi:hypothetical protein